MMTADSNPPVELPLLMGGGGGQPERLMLLGAPDRRGMVHVRLWTSADWSAPPSARGEHRETLLEWIESQAATGRTMNQSLHAVRRWLRADVTAAR